MTTVLEELDAALWDRVPQAMSNEQQRRAGHAMLDWMAVTLAGFDEPSSTAVRAYAVEHGAAGGASIISRGARHRLTPPLAALANGTAGHALDYDDTHLTFLGHPTAVVLPSALALAEHRGATGEDLAHALVTGIEAASMIGALVNPEHYNTGWHSTSTLGTIAAAVAAARLLKLDAGQTVAAMALGATQAAGVKSVFGTMTKPFHAGRAAHDGLTAALLASAGFTSDAALLDVQQGFWPGLSSADVRAVAPTSDGVAGMLFKFHAACYLTHAAIDAVCCHASDDIADAVRIVVRASNGCDGVCTIDQPRSGLEGKFSLRFAVAAAAAGHDMSRLDTYRDELVADDQIQQLMRRISIELDDRSISAAEVAVTTTDGRRTVHSADSGLPIADLDGQEHRLLEKFHALADPMLDDAAVVAHQCLTIGSQFDVRDVVDSLAVWHAPSASAGLRS